MGHGTPSSDNLLLGAGELFFDRIDNTTGLHTGERHLGNCTVFNISTEMEVKKKFSSMHAARRLYKSIITQIGASGKITMDEFDPANMALALFGEEGVFTQLAGTGASKTFLGVTQGRYYHLGKYKVMNVVVPSSGSTPASIAPAIQSGSISSTGVVTSSGAYTGAFSGDYFVEVTTANTAPGAVAGMKFKWKKGAAGTLSPAITVGATPALIENGISVLFALTGTQDFVVGDAWKISVIHATGSSYVEGVDYSVDAKTGRIYVIPDGGILDGDNLSPTFDYQAATCAKVIAGTTAKIEGYLRFVGDPTTGPAYMGDFWYVSLQPEGEAGFITEDWASLGIKFECQDDSSNHPKEPFYQLLQLT